MKKVLTFTFILFFSFIINAYSQWLAQTSGTNQHLRVVKFVDNNIGWAMGDNGTIVKTINAGVNWFSQISNSSTGISQCCMLDASTGYFVGGNSHKWLYRTFNGGNTWTNFYYNAGGEIEVLNIYGIGGIIGYLDAGRAYIRMTSDGGLTWFVTAWWQDYNLGPSYFLPNGIYGWIVEQGSSGDIKHTNDGGNNWISQNCGNNSNKLGVFFLDWLTGWIVGDGGTILHTVDEGSNWTQQVSNFNQWLGCVFFTDPNTGWVGGYGGSLLKTTNGGSNWGFQNSTTSFALNSIFFINANTGWIVGDGGTILKTTTGGGTFINTYNNNIPSQFMLYNNFPNPFNPTTAIRFDIPKSESVKLIVFDILGKEIAVLVNEKISAGNYEVDWDGSDYPSGVYFYKLITDEFVDVKKMVLVK